MAWLKSSLCGKAESALAEASPPRCRRALSLAAGRRGTSLNCALSQLAPSQAAKPLGRGTLSGPIEKDINVSLVEHFQRWMCLSVQRPNLIPV